jgi:transposase
MLTVSVTGRADLTDAQWDVLEPLLPHGKKPGRRRKYMCRQPVDGIRWRVRAGAPWWISLIGTGPHRRCTGCSAAGSATGSGGRS